MANIAAAAAHVTNAASKFSVEDAPLLGRRSDDDAPGWNGELL
jgi:hypothetical protein